MILLALFSMILLALFNMILLSTDDNTINLLSTDDNSIVKCDIAIY